MSKPKPTVGQLLYSLNIGEAARHAPQALTPVRVVKAGRKYFETKRDGAAWSVTTKYHMDTWREASQYGAGSQVYASEQEWQDEKDADVLCNRIYQAFSYGRNFYGVPILMLREIVGIIDRAKENQKNGVKP